MRRSTLILINNAVADANKVRTGVRSTKFVVDRTKTALGFAGVEDTDWENLQELPGA
jgi:hypothetical protein